MFYLLCILNRTLTPLLQGKTPYEILFGQAPPMGALKVFRCLWYAAHRPCVKDFVPCSRQCIFVGYTYGQKGWRVYDLDTHDFFFSRDVQLFEHTFPFVKLDTSSDEVRVENVPPFVFEDEAADFLPQTVLNGGHEGSGEQLSTVAIRLWYSHKTVTTLRTALPNLLNSPPAGRRKLAVEQPNSHG